MECIRKRNLPVFKVTEKPMKLDISEKNNEGRCMMNMLIKNSYVFRMFILKYRY